MNQVKKFDLEYSYDSEVDSIHIRITDKYEYKESLELEDGIILDFSTEGIPVSLEILDISDLFSVDKECFENIENINISIDITNFRISLNLLIFCRSAKFVLSFVLIPNLLPSSTWLLHSPSSQYERCCPAGPIR